MAELFSLMPESTSCENVRVEASRTLLRSALPTLLHVDAFAAGEISFGYAQDRLSGSLPRETIRTTRGRQPPRPRHLHTRSIDRAKPSASVLSLPVAAD
ncbi:MAG: hypothetical protein WBG26_19340, partial [Candidatus Binataceae bacterium]